jgi:hypothetical protein
VPTRLYQRTLRRVLREGLLGRAPLERGTGYGAGLFFHDTTEHELIEEAAECGWRVAYFERDGSRYPNAVLLPAWAVQ